MISLSLKDIAIGDAATWTKKYAEEDVNHYASITEDRNPQHVDEAYAKKSIFNSRVVHGMYVASLFSAIFGVKLPGLGSIYTKQSLKFTKPVYLNDTITAKVVVKEIIKDKNRVIFDCIAMNQRDEVVIVGEAEIMPPLSEVSG